ncbi:MAG: glycosyltransferase family 4 protein [Acidobacteriota bacterium]
MKILFALHVFPDMDGAVYRHYYEMMNQLRATDDQVHLLTPADFPVLTRFFRLLPLFYPILLAGRLISRAGNYDVIVFHSYCGWLFNFCKRLLSQRPITMTAFHGLEPLFFQRVAVFAAAQGRKLSLRFRIFVRLQNWLIKTSCQRSDYLTCLNSEEEQYLASHNYQSPNHIVRCPHWVEEQFFIDRDYQQTPSKILFIGQWLYTKGTRFVVDGFSAVATRYPQLRLMLVGIHTATEQVLADFPAELQSRIEVYGQIPHKEISTYYQAADLFLFPSLSEGFSRALLEAMAAGLPIITTAVGSAPDLLQDRYSAILVPVGDSDGIVRALEELLADAALRRTLGRQAQEAARQFLPQNVIEQYQKIWQQCSNLSLAEDPKCSMLD